MNWLLLIKKTEMNYTQSKNVKKYLFDNKITNKVKPFEIAIKGLKKTQLKKNKKKKVVDKENV